jgi:hypothetical protein
VNGLNDFALCDEEAWLNDELREAFSDFCSGGAGRRIPPERAQASLF